MKANELQIGDWVKIEDNFTTKITAIYDEMIQTQANYQSEIDGEWYSEAYIKDLKPIPLTAEILKKNGFMYKVEEICVTDAFHYWLLENSRFALDDDSWWRSVKDDKLRVKFSGFPLEYVHQLQHALRLCNIEKEIEL